MSSIDVIIPCYNYARYLRTCARSALSQTGVDVRILIIDDASQDDTALVSAAIAREDPRVQTRRHYQNRGHIATYNEGLRWSRSQYTLLISADDFLTPGSLHRATSVLDDHPELGFVYGRQIRFGENDAPPTPTDPGLNYSRRILPGREFIENTCATASNPVATPTVVVRTSLQHALGGYRDDLPHTADMELWLRFASRADVGIVDADQAYKRMHAANMQHDFVAPALGDILQRKTAIDIFLADCGTITELDRLKTAARRSVAMEAFWAASVAFDSGQHARCRDLLAFALNTDPDVVHRPEWRRFRWKQRIGSRAWAALRPLVTSARRSLRSIRGAVRQSSETSDPHESPTPDWAA
jgi:glycosyltransferase involved in cell wall biosynthesis